MIQNPPEGMTRIVPNVFYDDPAAALDFLAKTFGFSQKNAMPGPDGKIMHAEMTFEDGVFMMSPTGDSGEWTSPNAQGGKVTQSLYIYCDDVDAHHAAAKAAGATIIAEPETMFWGDRTYVARDPEGHRWTFATMVKEFDPSAIPGQ